MGIGAGYAVLTFSPQTLIAAKSLFFKQPIRSKPAEKQIIGFLPYWLVKSAKNNYANSITTLTYFGLTISPDGSIQKVANEQEEEPDWTTLRSDVLQKKLTIARNNNQTLSLLVFSGGPEAIDNLVSNPGPHAKNLVRDVAPIMRKYEFSDLNLDIESTKIASDEARKNFTEFITTVKKEIDKQQLGTLTVEITGNDLIKKQLIDVEKIGKIADYIVIMAYDFHYQGSPVSGAVAPIGGVGKNAEFDTQTVVNIAMSLVPRKKIILGSPSYGYSWETLTQSPRAATLPGSGVTVSNAKAQDMLGACSMCSSTFDPVAGENYVTHKDEQTGTYHQLYYPDEKSLQAKVALATKDNLAGVAIWALGYEGESMFLPLQGYKKEIVDITRL